MQFAGSRQPKDPGRVIPHEHGTNSHGPTLEDRVPGWSLRFAYSLIGQRGERSYELRRDVLRHMKEPTRWCELGTVPEGIMVLIIRDFGSDKTGQREWYKQISYLPLSITRCKLFVL